jgi:four helix bundle protein
MNDFRNLKVWRRAHALALHVYRTTAPFPAAERFGLTSQLRRAAVSVAANIAEGCGRRTRNEEAQFLHVALGSAKEVEYLTLLAQDLGLLDGASSTAGSALCTEVQRMLVGLLRARPRGTWDRSLLPAPRSPLPATRIATPPSDRSAPPVAPGSSSR